MSNLVGSYSVGSATYAGQPSGSLSDYQGAFTLNAASVPEPSTWAMMIIGFGAVAGTMRVRRKTAPALG
ncbi:PEPxxWA-CTERM sorting domain-containing protein [Sphingomonas lycopersici]|uniref:PEPxxWA-CTERM sorting domain-containing protein n=1 Tax=Sphingomonas lycopersici TaxID=2951807 RepID=A0AA41Z816_9SPHN|nr:PEPxxWA-CTERM sorting domain-containing protein [Sphingomonas lycopersici]MCW6535240.1 PEPxxWA-CTERM sorting domain-containing protein [Sphingomonas lycopersici]